MRATTAFTRRWQAPVLRWLTVIAILFTALGSALQSYVPPRIASLLAAQLQSRYGGAVHVSILAVPAWKLASGRFDRVTLTYLHPRVGPHEILPEISVLWRNGQVDLPALLDGRLRVLQQGSARVDVQISLDDLRRNLPSAIQQFHPRLAFKTGNIVVSGNASYAGITVPLMLIGHLSVTEGGRAVAFVPDRLTAEGYPMPLPPPRTVFALAAIALPPGAHLRIRSTTVVPGFIAIALVTVTPGVSPGTHSG